VAHTVDGKMRPVEGILALPAECLVEGPTQFSGRGEPLALPLIVICDRPCEANIDVCLHLDLTTPGFSQQAPRL